MGVDARVFADSEVASVDPEGRPKSSNSSRDAEPPVRPSAGRLLWGMGAAVVFATIVFGVMTLRNHAKFKQYQSATSVNAVGAANAGAPPAWQTRNLSVEQCIDVALEWAEGCPGVQSWCEGQLPRVLEACLASQSREAYCSEVGASVGSTRFGYDTCARRYDALESRYARRSRKKFCARSLRTVADHCASVFPESRLRDVPGNNLQID